LHDWCRLLILLLLTIILFDFYDFFDYYYFFDYFFFDGPFASIFVISASTICNTGTDQQEKDESTNSCLSATLLYVTESASCGGILTEELSRWNNAKLHFAIGVVVNITDGPCGFTATTTSAHPVASALTTPRQSVIVSSPVSSGLAIIIGIQTNVHSQVSGTVISIII